MDTNRGAIAIVDDDGGVRMALRELLRSMGFEAVTFGSAEEFLDSGRTRQVGALIADVHLPGMTGAALVTALADAGCTLPALLITAHDDPATAELIRRAGPIPHLRKPFSDEDLLDAMQRALGT
ncbi:MAG TPA: response regulator [Longimicrobium sp.]|nr:response regulator [Longimicrobium sp.]